MSRTITALFDTRADAEAGRDRLLATKIDAGGVQIHDQSGIADGRADAPSYSTVKEPGIWASIKNAFLPDEDRHAYEEGVRRGGFLLTADVNEDQIGEAVEALDGVNGVDIEERSASWKAESWSSPSASSSAMFGGSTDEPMDDDLIYGERDMDRGSQVVRSYKTDRPLHEQMRDRTTDASDRDPAYGERAKSGSTGATLAGLGNEGMGNVKQGIGSLAGNDELKRWGLAQERQGETQQGKTPGYDN